MDKLAQANTYQRQGAAQRAMSLYTEILQSDPSNVPAMANLATLLAKQNKLASAEALLRRVTQSLPYEVDQWVALGNVCMRRGDFVEARYALNVAMDLRPENPDIYVNLAGLCYQERDYRAAENYLYKVVTLGLDTPRVRFDLAHNKMAQADLKDGLSLYENRWSTLEHSPAWDFHIPEWTSESLVGKRILVHEEQGFGDTIMTFRFVRELASIAKVTVAVNKGLIRLFESQNWPNVQVANLADLPANSHELFDFHSPLFSVMRHLKINKGSISPKPYLTAPGASASGLQGQVSEGMFNVGICWASGDRGERKNARRRATDLELWLPLGGIPNVRLWSLQKDDEARAIAKSAAQGLIVDVMDSVSDWLDTAALVSSLDLVVSVDTGVVHLAGALGTPVWMVSQYSPCWRWWCLAAGSGLPWYKNMRIFRQTDPNDWRPIMSDVVDELELKLMEGELGHGANGKERNLADVRVHDHGHGRRPGDRDTGRELDHR